jgi:hypothetical protein
VTKKKARTRKRDDEDFDEVLIRTTVRMVAVQMVTMQRLLLNAKLATTAKKVNQASQELGWDAVRQLDKIEARRKKRRRVA